METGWLILSDWTDAVSFVEVWLPDSGQDLDYYSTHNWGSSKNYEVSWDSWYERWDSCVDSSRKVSVYGEYLFYPPANDGEAWAETQDTDNVMDSHFTNVEWKDYYGGWNWFNHSFYIDTPYTVVGTYTNFTATGP